MVYFNSPPHNHSINIELNETTYYACTIVYGVNNYK